MYIKAGFIAKEVSIDEYYKRKQTFFGFMYKCYVGLNYSYIAFYTKNIKNAFKLWSMLRYRYENKYNRFQVSIDDEGIGISFNQLERSEEVFGEIYECLVQYFKNVEVQLIILYFYFIL